MADLKLHCNSLTCRAELDERGVVTTCSHIFCEDCAHTSGLSANQGVGPRVCPACTTELNNPDDAVIAVLRPPEDYKTSVLSGMSPTIIMECAARGLAFWSYQATQEIKYQTYLVQSLADKYQGLNIETNRIVDDANDAISKLQNRSKALQDDQVKLVKANDELQVALKERNKAFAKLKSMYDAARAKEMAVNVQHAAEDDADNTILNTAAAHRHNDRLGTGMGPPETSTFAHAPVTRQGVEQIHSRQRSGGSGSIGEGDGQFMRNLHSFNPAGPASMQTPSVNRTRLPILQRTGPTGATPLSRQPLRSMSSNIQAGLGSQYAPKVTRPLVRRTPMFNRTNPGLPNGFR